MSKILVGTILQCCSCDNKVRLTEDYHDDTKNFKCQVCLGGYFISPVTDKLFIKGSYTSCNQCKTIFLINQDYLGKSVACNVCKYQTELAFL